jgi:hypothetical protein
MKVVIEEFEIGFHVLGSETLPAPKAKAMMKLTRLNLARP